MANEVDSDVDLTGDSAPKEDDEFPVNIQRLEEADMHESGDGFELRDEADKEKKGEDEDQGQDMISKPEHSLEEMTTPNPSIPQSGNDPQSGVSASNEENESPNINIQRPKKEMARDINESGEYRDEDQDQNAEESLQQTASSGLPQDNQPPSRVGGNDKSPVKTQKHEDMARDINKRGDGFKHKDEDQDQESLQQTASPGLQQDNQPQSSDGVNKLFFAAVVAVLVACCVSLYSSDSTPPVPKEFNVVEVFTHEMEKLKTSFPNQRPELWRRSLIHLRRHLKTEHPTEPVSLILTSGHRAERTLGCLAQCLAQAFSTAHNSSVLNINGKSKASQDSDQVKLDIDSELRNAFEGKKFAAVIHRFEELPPGSTLIFYRYCDHENAAYKNIFLAFTVMLDGEVEVPSNVTLGRVEEMVQEHVKQKFVPSDKLATFNQMDVDKLSGLWSRISHLILPVVAEQKIEYQGCGDCYKSF